MASSTIYPKRLAASEIRLLKLLPGRWMDDLVCEIEYCPLEDKREDRVRYSAISYVWGSEPATYPVQVDRSTVLVTPSLDQALRHYRRRMETGSYWTWNGLPRRLWVDSICINQNDKEEQGTQVAMMDRVYATATQVVVFLGGGLDVSAPSYARDLAELAGTLFQCYGLIVGAWDFIDEATLPPPEAEVKAKRLLATQRIMAEMEVFTGKDYGIFNQVVSGGIDEADQICAKLNNLTRDHKQRTEQREASGGHPSGHIVPSASGPDMGLIYKGAPLTQRDMCPAALFSFLEAVVVHEGCHLKGVWETWDSHPATTGLSDLRQKELLLSQGLELLIKSNWWQRAWTLQEGVVGTYPLFILGGTSAPWKLLREAARRMGIWVDSSCTCCMRWIRSRPFSLERHLLQLTGLVKDLSCSRSLVQVSRHSSGTLTDYRECNTELLHLFGAFNRKRAGPAFAADYFLRLLEKHRKRHATDPRDKAYAIFPLVGMAHVQPLLVPNYTKDVCQTYVDVARAIISASGYLDILAFAGNASGPLALPSWVPDWSSHENLDGGLRLASLENYHTSGEEKAEVCIDNDTLITKAAFFGVIRSRGRVMNSRKRLWTTVHQWLRLAVCNPARKEGYRRDCKSELLLWDAFRRTVHADMLFDHHRGFRMGLQVPQRAKEALEVEDDQNKCNDIADFSVKQTRERLVFELHRELRQGDGDPTEQRHGFKHVLERTLAASTEHRRFFISHNGVIGLSPANTWPGDCIFAIKGSRTYHILRRERTTSQGLDANPEGPHHSVERYRLIGDCYLDGFMDLRLDDQFRDRPEVFQGHGWETITIV